MFTERPDDAFAVYLGQGAFGAVADGNADDSAAVQAAIDHVVDTTGSGVVFVAPGRYRLTRTIHLWTGIRLIGYGKTRPVFVLGRNTPGYQEGHEFLGTGRYMLQFASGRPQAGGPVIDANEFTFYSGISNLDFEIGEGNPAAIAIRFHVAQHSFLAHMNIKVGQGRAGLEDVGNNANDLHIEGGDYGIISVRTSPAWQFLLMDSAIEGQRKAAIHTQEVGMTLVRDRIAHTPIAVQVTPGMAEQLYGRDLTFEDISQTALILGDAAKAHHQVTMDHIVCDNVPQFIQGGEGVIGWITVHAPAKRYVEDYLTVGLEIRPDGRERGAAMRHRESVAQAKAIATDIPALPPMQEWTNVRSVGAMGDGGTDDTAALQAAIDGHRVLYFPSGIYRVSNTLRLREDSVLIGFNPVTAVITVWDNEAAFQGEGPNIPLVQSARGGNAIISGVGIATGSVDPRVSGLEWRAGPKSMVEDVNFAAGHGRGGPLLGPKLPRAAGFGPGPAPAGGAAVAGTPGAATPPQRPAGGFPRGPNTADTQYPSLWVHDNGGGLFRGIWTSNTNAKAGLLVEDTTTPSVVYQMSCEHHMHHETQFHHASNWTVYALQTEEENPAGAESFSVELIDAHAMTFTNLFMYRVSRNVLPKLNAVEATNSSDIHFENVHDFSQTRLAYDNSIFYQAGANQPAVNVRTHDFTVFNITPAVKPGAPLPLPAGIFAAGAKLEQVASGFSNASGLTADETGHIFFTDAAMHKIYRWNADSKQAELLTDKVQTPMSLGFVAPGSLLALDYSRAVFSVDPKTGLVDKITPAPTPEADTNLLLPIGFHNSMETLIREMEHRGIVYAPRSNMAIVANVTDEPRGYYYAPGTHTAIMAGGNWQPMLQASQWRTFAVGDEHLVVSEEDDTTYQVKMTSLRSIAVTQFAPRGGSSVVTDTAGNVYVAEGQLFIYNSAGKQIGIVEVPERPGSLRFGGDDHRTLFIGARGSLFAIRTQSPGR